MRIFEIENFHPLKKEGSATSKYFLFWNPFIDESILVLQQMTRSFRETNLNLHLFAKFRIIELCLGFDRINYRYWLATCYRDYVTLPIKFSEF